MHGLYVNGKCIVSARKKQGEYIVKDIRCIGSGWKKYGGVHVEGCMVYS